MEKQEDKVVVKLTKQPLASERKEIRQKRLKVFLIVFICLLMGVVGLLIGLNIAKPKTSEINTTKLEEIKYYLENVWLYNDDYENIDTYLEDKAYYGMADFDDDPYTTYMSTDEVSEYASSINMDYVGIGVQYNASSFIITRVFKDSPAENAGIEEGDIIVSIDNENVSGKTSDEIKELVLGQQGTTIDLTVNRAGQEITMTVVRAQIDGTVYAYTKDDYVVLEISSFGQNTGNECIKYLDDYTDYSKIIIDLRDNGGGYESAVQEVAGIFLGKDKVMMHKIDTNGNSLTDYTISNACYDNFKKIVILTNGSTASASEVLTLALKEGHDDVTIVGETTYGKGVMQTQYSLSDGSVIKLTTAYWTSPNNNSINGIGISPDIEVKLDDIFYETVYKFNDENDTYKYDSVSTFVRIAQMELNYLGYTCDRNDGYFDNSTLVALNNFKADNQLDTDGILDNNTYEALYSKVISLYSNDESKDVQMLKGIEVLNG